MLEQLLSFVVYGLVGINVLLAMLIWRARRHATKGALGGRRADGSLRLLAVMGSGGHTTEMLKLMDSLGQQYSPRFFVIANTDAMSEKKVLAFEQSKEKGHFEIVRVPRSREVGQSYLTSVWTTLVATLYSISVILKCRPEILLCNGPGTGLPLCFAAYLFDLLRLFNCRIVFVESICRVRKLSLTGLILYQLRMTDAFVVQWPELVEKYPGTTYLGRLV